MSDKNGEECWYALKVFYNRVFELEKQLSQEGVRSYIPLLHEDTVAGDKKIRKRKPAVSSLMFIRQSEHYLLELQDRMKASCPFMAYFDAIDLVVSGVASLCALVLVRLLLPPLSNISKFALLWIGCAVVYSFITFFLLKTYRSVIRHSTLREIAKFVVAVIGKELLLGLTILLYPPTPLFGMHMLALLLFDLLLTLCGLILIRVAMIIVYDLVKNNLKSRKQHQLVLVYGLSEKSVSLVTRLQSSPHYKVVGFLTFGRRMKNHTIAECPVYYFENEYSIRYLRQRYDIDAVLFPTNEEAQAEQERLIRYCVESNLKILIAPPIDEVIDGKIMRQSIREIKIEDLLGRPEIKISLDEIIANFREKTVIVTGAAFT